MLRFVLSNDPRRPSTGGTPETLREAGNNVLRRRVEDLLCGVQTEAVKVKLVRPVSRVRTDQLPDCRRLRAIEINRFTPFIGIAASEVMLRELFEVVAVWAEMVIHHI